MPIRAQTTAQVLHEAAEEEAETAAADSAAAAASGGNGAPAGGMAKVLTVWDVIAYGIGSTLGAGIYAITGAGAHAAGPAVVLSFCVAAIACMFSAFSYMEFAARVPIAGSAYTFAYVALGELAAWFVGWNLTLEYGPSAAASPARAPSCSSSPRSWLTYSPFVAFATAGVTCFLCSAAISAAVVARTWSSNLKTFIVNCGGNYPSWLSDTDVSWVRTLTHASP
jgi:amino acid transporter